MAIYNGAIGSLIERTKIPGEGSTVEILVNRYDSNTQRQLNHGTIGTIEAVEWDRDPQHAFRLRYTVEIDGKLHRKLLNEKHFRLKANAKLAWVAETNRWKV